MVMNLYKAFKINNYYIINIEERGSYTCIPHNTLNISGSTCSNHQLHNVYMSRISSCQGDVNMNPMTTINVTTY